MKWCNPASASGLTRWAEYGFNATPNNALIARNTVCVGPMPILGMVAMGANEHMARGHLWEGLVW